MALGTCLCMALFFIVEFDHQLTMINNMLFLLTMSNCNFCTLLRFDAVKMWI